MNNLAWIALETVGDDAHSCELFEVAVVVTNERLEPLKQFQSAVMGARDRPSSVKMRVSRELRQRFAANGLWDEMATASVTPLSVDDNLARLFAPAAEAGPLTVIGSGWDRQVIAAQYQAADAFLAPGSWDVPSFVGIAQRFIPRALVPLEPDRERVAFRVNSSMQNLANVVNAVRGAKGSPTP